MALELLLKHESLSQSGTPQLSVIWGCVTGVDIWRRAWWFDEFLETTSLL